jgi:hypothetical protein
MSDTEDSTSGKNDNNSSSSSSSSSNIDWNEVVKKEAIGTDSLDLGHVE